MIYRVDQEWLHLLLELAGGVLVDDREGHPAVRVEVIPDTKTEASSCSTAKQEQLVLVDTPAAVTVMTAGHQAAVLRPHQLHAAPGGHHGLQAELGQAGGGGWLDG